MRVNAINLKGCTKKKFLYYDKTYRSYMKCKKKSIECEIMALVSLGISKQAARKAVIKG